MEKNIIRVESLIKSTRDNTAFRRFYPVDKNKTDPIFKEAIKAQKAEN